MSTIYSSDVRDDDEVMESRVFPSLKAPSFPPCRSSIHHYRNLAESREIGWPRQIHASMRREPEAFVVAVARISERVAEVLNDLDLSGLSHAKLSANVDVEAALSSVRASIKELDTRLAEATSRLAEEHDASDGELIDWLAVARHASSGAMPTTHDEDGQPIRISDSALALSSVGAVEWTDDESLPD